MKTIQNKNLELIEDLNKREIEILALLALGEKQNEIAKKLFIERKTVYFHVRNIKDKLNAGSTQELYNLAYKLKDNLGNKSSDQTRISTPKYN